MKKLVYLSIAVAVLFSFVAACAAPTPEVVEKEVIVEKEVPVTVEVEKEVVVKEKVVETVVVEVEVTREVIVDPTACNLAAPASAATVNMIGWAFPVTELYADEIEKCNAVDNLAVNTQLLDSASAHEQVRLALSGGGESPWAIVHATPADIAEWGSQGWLQPIDDLVEEYWDEYDLGDIPQTAWDSASFEGNIYGVPFLANTLHMFYRTDLFEEYGLEPPTTYDGVIAACEALADEPSTDIPFTMNLHAGWAWEIEFFHFLKSFGAPGYLNEDNTPAFDGPEGVAGLTKMKEVVDACMGLEGLTYSIDDSEIGMETGRLAFVNIWASRAPAMDDPEKSDFIGLIGFAPAAAPNPGGSLGGSTWLDTYTIPATTDVDRDLAFRVIMEATDLRSQTDAAELGIVTRGAVAKAGVGGRYLPAVAETLADGVGGYAANPAISLARAALGNWLPLVGTGEMSPQESLDAAAEEYIAEATAQGFID